MSEDVELFRLASDLESQRGDLFVAADVEGVSGLLSEELYYAHSSGLVDDKKSFLGKFRNGELLFQSVDARLDSVSALGEQAFQASGLLDLEVKVNGKARAIQVIYLVTWRQEDGAWRLVGFQATSASDAAVGKTARSSTQASCNRPSG